jgi:hypothetical protein
MKYKNLINQTQTASFLLIGIVIFGFVFIISQLIFYDEKPENFGVIGDAVGGILNPIIAIAGALLTFLAFYIQKLANDDLKNQFIQQKKDDHADFLFKNYKDRVMLIINEINNFNISFHGGSLISDVNSLKDQYSKKYNFIGIQAINLFLIEYFALKEKKRKQGETELIIENSYHATYLHIGNLITAYYTIHVYIENCDLEDNPRTELLEILQFAYFSKFNYFFEFLLKQFLEEKLKSQIEHLREFYKRT